MKPSHTTMTGLDGRDFRKLEHHSSCLGGVQCYAFLVTLTIDTQGNHEVIVPRHIGFIMDGNGRWAQKRGLPRAEGHWAGIGHIRQVADICYELGIEVVSAYVWSTENWSRPSAEIRHLMGCIRSLGPKLARGLHAKHVRILHTGSRDDLSEPVLRVIDNAIRLTRNNGPRVLNLVFNYGGRAELVHAVRQSIIQEIQPEKITETTISKYLYTHGLPDVDLVVRSGGDRRLSNFFLWQSAYATVYIAEAFWPALSRGDIEEAIRYYNKGFEGRGETFTFDERTLQDQEDTHV